MCAMFRLQDGGAKQVDKGPTGKQFFLQQEALGKEVRGLCLAWRTWQGSSCLSCWRFFGM